MRVLFSQNLIAVSKPRCGSTSVRQILDDLLRPDSGDFAVDVAKVRPPFHPHLSAPYLKSLLIAEGHDISRMTTIIFTRHPVEMLWSYYNFFRPDRNGRYNYDGLWNPRVLLTFEDWVMKGSVGMIAEARAMAPAWISETNLSPLSLEAHANDREGQSAVDHIFRLEEIGRFLEWLAERTGRAIAVKHVNMSGAGPLPALGSHLKDRVRELFPAESRIYGL